MNLMSLAWVSCCALACCACAANSPVVKADSFAVGALSAVAGEPIQLADWTPMEDLFAVGSLSDGSGEITIDDGEVWMTRAADDAGLKTERNFESDASCTQLVHARVKVWIELEISHEIAAEELAQKLIGLARSAGLDTRRPIPLRIVGEFRDIEWHVGREPTIRNASAQGALLGFLGPNGPEVFAPPSARLHLHLLQASRPGQAAEVSGHVESASLCAGARISFPSAGN